MRCLHIRRVKWKDVLIVGAATAWTNVETGETHVLYFNQILWYGRMMPMSLIDPQPGAILRSQSMRWRDWPSQGIWNPTWRLRYDNTVSDVRHYFESRVPSQWELENCNTIIMIDEYWDPATELLADTSSNKWSRVEKERRNISLIQSKPGNRFGTMDSWRQSQKYTMTSIFTAFDCISECRNACLY